jgi:hypothetical protein
MGSAMTAIKNINTVDLSEAATFYEKGLGEGMPFAHLSQALRHAVCVPLAKHHHSAKIVTKSGAEFGWEAINLLHDHLRSTDKN